MTHPTPDAGGAPVSPGSGVDLEGLRRRFEDCVRLVDGAAVQAQQAQGHEYYRAQMMLFEEFISQAPEVLAALERIPELEANVVRLADGLVDAMERYEARVAELEAKIARLTRRGIEDMQHELAESQARVAELEREIERLREAHRAPQAEAIRAGARLLETMGRSPESWRQEAERWRVRAERAEAALELMRPWIKLDGHPESLAGRVHLNGPIMSAEDSAVIRAALAAPDARIPSSEAENGAALIAAERRRQVDEEGWTPEHDDEHVAGELAMAAAVYAAPDWKRDVPAIGGMTLRGFLWPSTWAFKPGGRVSELVKAGALIAAEIERQQRVAVPEDRPQ